MGDDCYFHLAQPCTVAALGWASCAEGSFYHKDKSEKEPCEVTVHVLSSLKVVVEEGCSVGVTVLGCLYLISRSALE